MEPNTKYGDLANFAPDDLAALEGAVVGSLAATRRQRSLLAAFVHATDLDL